MECNTQNVICINYAIFQGLAIAMVMAIILYLGYEVYRSRKDRKLRYNSSYTQGEKA